MKYSRIAEAHVLVELQIVNDKIHLTELNLFDNTHREVSIKLSDFNKDLYVEFTNTMLKTAIEKLERPAFIFFVIDLIEFYLGDNSKGNDLWRKIHPIYAESLGMEIDTTMVLGYDKEMIDSNVKISLYCLIGQIYAFDEGFLKVIFQANSNVDYDFLDELDEVEFYHTFHDYYEYNINTLSHMVEKKVKYYSRKKKLTKLLP